MATPISGSNVSHDSFVEQVGDSTPSHINLGASGADVLLYAAGAEKSFLLRGMEEVRLIGGLASDVFRVGTLAGTTILRRTVYIDSGAGNDSIDGSTADRRLVVEAGDGKDEVIGGSDGDQLLGGGGDDRLNGGGGADTLAGGIGNDSYFVDSGDMIVERSGEGNDTVYVRSSYALAAGLSVETVRTTGSATTYTADLTGNEIANILVGNAAANRLDGGTGADALWGYGGNDIYFVDNSGDVVREAAGGGNDTVVATANFALGAGSEVETIRTTGSTSAYAVNLSGNELANAIAGNAAANVIDGGGGADLMYGYGGNDSYYVDDAGDVVMEAGHGGFDVVYASTSYTLARTAEIEELRTLGSGTTYAVNLTGNAYNNTLVGNAAANRIDGGTGRDVMYGYGGNDSYYVDDARDMVVEGAGGGHDAVYTTTSYTLAAGNAVEELRTLGSSTGYAADLTGNELANAIVGNAAANTLHGGGGADSLWGYGGNDMLFGDEGADTFVITAGFGKDTIADFGTSGTGDSVRFLNGTFSSFADLMSHAAQQGDDVVFTLDANNSVTLQNTQLAMLSAQSFTFG